MNTLSCTRRSGPARPTVQTGFGLWRGRLFLFDALPSTSAWALDHAACLRNGDVILARSQTAGRGRHGRAWFGSRGKSLAFSVVLREPALLRYAANAGQATAYGLSQALRQFGLSCRLKWPNDVLAGERKIAGILAELGPDALIVGIGLNVNLLEGDLADASLDRSATSLAIETGGPFPPDLVLECAVHHIEAALDELLRRGPAPLFQHWRNRDALLGSAIGIRTGLDADVAGTYEGISPEGYLRLRLQDGSCREFASGDVVKVRSSRHESLP